MTAALLQADVVGLGVTTPIGLDVPSVEAAVRAGTTRFQEADLLNLAGERQVLSLVAEEYLPPLVLDSTALSTSWSRMLRLATYALADACAPSPIPPPLFLAIAEERWDMLLPAPPVVFSQLAQQGEIELNARSSRLFRQGGAGGLLALRDALALLSARHCPFVVVGGVDTFCNARRLAVLDGEERLHGRSMDGFVPGEAAAFFLLAASGVARQHGLEPLARVAGVGIGSEKGHRYSPEPYRGDGLADAFQALFAASPPGTPKVRCVYAGFNGESLPAKEWGVAHLRSVDRFEEDLQIEHPADCIGDAGAALGPFMVALATARLHAEPSSAPILIWSTSDSEERAAALLERV